MGATFWEIFLYVAFALAWTPFGVWVARKRRASRAVIREGAMVESVIVKAEMLTFRGSPLTRGAVRFEADRTPHVAEFSLSGHPPANRAGGRRCPCCSLREQSTA